MYGLIKKLTFFFLIISDLFLTQEKSCWKRDDLFAFNGTLPLGGINVRGFFRLFPGLC